MTASNREASISKTLQYEGGYTNDPRDPGGATNWGITIYDARLYWKKDATPADVKAMPKAVAIDIYRQKYWAKMGCDDRAAGPDFVDFDYGVNSGVGRVFNLRKVLDAQNLSAVDYVKRACASRLSFLHALRTWSVFGGGWGRRVTDVEATGVRMALGTNAAPVLKKEATKAAKKTIAHGTTAASGTSAAPVIHHALPAHMDFGSKAGVAMLAIGAALLVVYFVWNAVHNSHRAAAYTAQASK